MYKISLTEYTNTPTVQTLDIPSGFTERITYDVGCPL